MYVQDGSINAIQSVGTSGFYPLDYSSYIEWNTQSNTGTYNIPFVSTSGSNDPVSISITSTSVPGTLKVSNVDEPAGFPIWQDVNAINRYWTIDLSGYSTLPSGSVTLNYLVSDVPSFFPALVTKYYNTGDWQWTNNELASINYTAHDATFPINSYLQTNNAYHTWSLINPSSALPITLVSLYAVNVENKFIDIVWQTSTEINNSGFVIERSQNGIQFDSIGWVEGHNNSVITNDYQFSDYNVIPNVVYYYRLRQLDNNGHSTLTYIVSASIGAVIGVSELIPNPTNYFTRAIVDVPQEGTAYVIVYDDLGREVGTSSLLLSAGQNSILIDVRTLAAATYTVVIKISDQIFTRKLVVTKI